MGHVVALEPTFAERRGPKLQLMWQCVDACYTPCLDLELVCGGTRSSGCRQRPPGPPRERLRTRRWGQFFSAHSVILNFLLGSRRCPPREMPKLEVRKHPPSRLRNALSPWEALKLEVRKLKMSIEAP
jgi:hypothetical protein